MTNEEQKALLTEFIDRVRDQLLSKADKWPEEWDGFELRWLADEAFEFEAPVPSEDRKHRYREFLNTCHTEHLY